MMLVIDADMTTAAEVSVVAEDEIQRLSKGLRSWFLSISKPSQPNVQSTILELRLLIARLLSTYALPEISGPHRVGSCNLLCAIIQQCLNASLDKLRIVGVDTQIWLKIFDLYLHRSDHSRAKSMRLVLMTLGQMLSQNSDQVRKGEIYSHLSSRLSSIIFDQDAHSRVKPAFQALDYFLSKDLLPLSELLKFTKLASEVDKPVGVVFHNLASVASANCPSAPVRRKPDVIVADLVLAASLFVSRCLQWIGYPDVAPAVGKTIVVFYDHIRQQPENDNFYYIQDSRTPIWVQPVIDSVEQHPETLDALRQHLFPEIFALRVSDIKSLLDTLGLDDFLGGALPDSMARAQFLFSVLQVAKSLGYVRETDFVEASLDDEPWKSEEISLDSAMMGKYLTHQSVIIRSAALALLIHSPSTTLPLPRETLRVLKANLGYLHADLDSKFRNDLLNITKQVVNRLRGGVVAWTRATSLSRHSETDLAPPETDPSEEFLRWYINFLTTELQPSSRYQTHIMALKALVLLLQSGLDGRVPPCKLMKAARTDLRWPKHIAVFSPALNRTLLDLLMDPFEDVRTEAAALLQMNSDRELQQGDAATSRLTSSSSNSSTPDHSKDMSVMHSQEITFRSRAYQKMRLSCRADHCDGFAHGYELAFVCIGSPFSDSQCAQDRSQEIILFEDLVRKLESHVKATQQNLVRAADDSPLHGYLAALRYILESRKYTEMTKSPAFVRRPWKAILQRIIVSCAEIWSAVKDILCNDFPEGHLPENGDGLDVDTKDVLSYSWRALKESSFLLKTIISRAEYSTGSISMLDKGDLAKIGNLTFTQLIELRHRGAFTAVSLTFMACCHHCSDIGDGDLQDLLSGWFQETLCHIRNRSIINTRRSAGIPALITGLVGASSVGVLSRRIFHELFQEAHGHSHTDGNGFEAKLPQVHAMNCLKEIFTDTKLGATSERYIAEGLDLAVESLGSNTWAIRNGGIMLFRALIDRLIGTSTKGHQVDSDWSRGSSKVSYEKYSSLAQLLPRLLGSHSPPMQMTVPNLSLTNSVQMVFPALDLLRRAGPPKQGFDTLKQMVFDLLAHPVWHIRDLAARTYCTFVNLDDLNLETRRLMQHPQQSQNGLHGRCLTIRYMVSRAIHMHTTAARLGETLILVSAWDLDTTRCCPFVLKAFLECINSILAQLIKIRLSESGRSRQSFLPGLTNHETPTDERIGVSSKVTDSIDRFLNRVRNQSVMIEGDLLFEIHQSSVYVNMALCMILKEDRLGLRNVLLDASDYTSAWSSVVREAVIMAPDAAHTTPTRVMLSEIVRAVILQVRRGSARLAAEAMQTLADLFEQVPWVREKFRPELEGLFNWNASVVLTSPSCVESELRLRAYDLTRRYQTYLDIIDPGPTLPLHFGAGVTENGREHGPPRECFEDFQKWCYMIWRASTENNKFDTRFAAARALIALISEVAHTNDILRPLYLQPYLLLYDTLNDDEEEIRELGATLVSRIIDERGTMSLTPLAASGRFLEWLSSHYPDSDDLRREAISRMTSGVSYAPWILHDPSSEPRTLTIPIEEQMNRAKHEDPALFAVEKQNLFIDPVRESEVWSGVLLRQVLPSKNDKGSNHARKELCQWLTPLPAIMQLLELSCPAGEMDGPLGWMSKPDSFTVLMRIIISARIAMLWGEIDPSALEWLKKTCQQEDVNHTMHELWLVKLDSIMGEHVKDRDMVDKLAQSGHVKLFTT